MKAEPWQDRRSEYLARRGSPHFPRTSKREKRIEPPRRVLRAEIAKLRKELELTKKALLVCQQQLGIKLTKAQ